VLAHGVILDEHGRHDWDETRKQGRIAKSDDSVERCYLELMDQCAAVVAGRPPFEGLAPSQEALKPPPRGAATLNPGSQPTVNGTAGGSGGSGGVQEGGKGGGKGSGKGGDPTPDPADGGEGDETETKTEEKGQQPAAGPRSAASLITIANLRNPSSAPTLPSPTQPVPEWWPLHLLV